MQIIITSPSLNPASNVSGISSVTKFIIENNTHKYIHFELGKKDNEKGGIYRIKSILKNLINWNKVLNKYPEAIIHYNFPLSKFSIIRDSMFILIVRLKKRIMIIHLHGGNFLTDSHIPQHLNWILKKIFSLPTPFIVLSDIEKNIIKKRYNPQSIQVLPNCVELKEAKSFNREINLEKALVVGYLGRITETKGMEYLLEAFKILKKRGIPFILKIAGKEEIENQYLPNFEKALGKQFVYEGLVSGEVKSKFLKSLDVFVLPSFFEGLPMSLLECMSYGVVPLITNVGSVGEVVQDKSNGVIIKVKDTTSIVEQLIFLHEHREQLKIYSIKAKNKILSEYSPDLYIKKLKSIYDNAKQKNENTFQTF